MNSSYFPPKTRSLIGWNGWVSQSEAWFLAGNSWISFLKLRYKVTSTYHKMKKGKGNFEFSSTQKFEMWKNFEGICCKNFSSSMNPKIVKSVSLDFTKSLERVYHTYHSNLVEFKASHTWDFAISICTNWSCYLHQKKHRQHVC